MACHQASVCQRGSQEDIRWHHPWARRDRVTRMFAAEKHKNRQRHPACDDKHLNSPRK